MAAEDSSVSGVAGRYATALFELARDEKSVDAVRADLDTFETLLNDNPDLVRLVRSPLFTADVQSKALLSAVRPPLPLTMPPVYYRRPSVALVSWRSTCWSSNLRFFATDSRRLTGS